ncbi:hypothetical protein M426DRAFT_119840 [Hypoxylon sp. CI-4A]|nr:hypothetical protein M426DRAFT_119840 [Hypoxylon sp. CI-4A]
MAMRLALDMGLNFDFGNHTERSITPEEGYMRRRLYWVIYCDDKLASSYTGRVCTFLVCLSTLISHNLPTKTYQLQGFQGAVERSLERPKEIEELTIVGGRYPSSGQLLQTFIILCQILEKIMLSLYVPKSTLRHSQREEFFSSCLLELQNWRYDLPEDMRLERYTISQPPAIFTYHMIWHVAHIQLTKPFLVRGREPDEISATDGPLSLQRTRMVCYGAAVGICNTARKYRSVFGSFRRSAITATYCTLSAVLVLIDAKRQDWEGVSRQNNEKDIDLCIMVLQELGTSWNPARRMHQNIVSIYQQLQAAVGRGAALHGSSDDVDEEKVDGTAPPTLNEVSGSRPETGLQGSGDHLNYPPDWVTTSSLGTSGDTTLEQAALDNHGVAFTASSGLPDNFLGHDWEYQFGSLPTDYGIFGTLSRGYFEDTW